MPSTATAATTHTTAEAPPPSTAAQRGRTASARTDPALSSADQPPLLTTWAAQPAQPIAAAAPTDVAAGQPELLSTLTAFRTRADGTHQLNVALHPADLGAVQVHALLHAGTLTVTIHCADEAARHAVTAALPQLRERLGDSLAVDVQVGNGANGNAANGNADPRTAPPPHQDVYDADPAPTPAPHDRQTPDQPIRRRFALAGLDRWM